MLLEIQKKIERLYGLSGIPSIEDFLIQQDQLENLTLGSRPQVLFYQQAKEVSIGVYLGQDLTQKVENQILTFEEYTILVEEISHFLYLFWNIHNGKKIQLLDIEVQGEIDKFLIFADQMGFSQELVERLFGKYLLRPNLPKQDIERYHRAHQLGQRFVHKIVKMKKDQLLSFLRTFYRQGSIARISQLQKLVF